MKRVDLIRHLERCGCEFFREGGNHTVYVHRSAGKSSSVPRHREVNDFLARQNLRRPSDSTTVSSTAYTPAPPTPAARR
jgi:predicted RNA binding protein YcfA (HicA-like mRNA interferase family)